jgi:hypothetical protein
VQQVADEEALELDGGLGGLGAVGRVHRVVGRLRRHVGAAQLAGVPLASRRRIEA